MADAPTIRRAGPGRLAALVVATAVGVAATAVVGTGPAQAGARASADLSVGVVHAPDSPETGDDIAFTITATNDGPDTAVDVVAGIALDYPLRWGDLPEGCSASWAGPSVLCELGDVASGTSAVVTVEVHAYGSGLYTVPVAVASPTSDPDSADRVVNDVVLIRRGPSQAERYVSGIFPIILERDPGPSGLAYWSERWKRETFGYPGNPARIPAGIMASDEYRRLRIGKAYEAILGRSADPGGLAAWVARARAGWTYQQIEAQLIGSGEFASSAGGDVVAAMFEAVFQRSPSAAELRQWKQHPAASGPRWFLARAMQKTTAAYDLIIAETYGVTFGTPPDPIGRYVWQLRLRQGFTPEQLWAQLLVSSRFLQDYPYTEDDYLELDEGYVDSNADGVADGSVHDLSDRADALVAALDAS